MSLPNGPESMDASGVMVVNSEVEGKPVEQFMFGEPMSLWDFNDRAASIAFGGSLAKARERFRDSVELTYVTTKKGLLLIPNEVVGKIGVSEIVEKMGNHVDLGKVLIHVNNYPSWQSDIDEKADYDPRLDRLIKH